MSGVREEILGQLDWLADELEAQQDLLELIPPVLRGARPPGADLSLLDLYARLAAPVDPDTIGERRLREATAGLSALVRLAIRRRRDLVSRLEALDPAAWGDPEEAGSLSGRMMALIEDDTDTLRQIAERLYEGGLGRTG